MKWALVSALFASGAFASEERLAVVVGANLGDGDEPALRFAESDATRVRDTLVELGGVSPGRATLVTSGGARAVLDALTFAQGRAAELTAQGTRVTFVFYFSGHGDEATLHLGGDRLELSRVRERIAAIPAQARLSVLDSCRTTGRGKGVRRAPPFELSLDPSSQQGTVELRAGAPGEVAQESDELGGALFTHALLSAMRGAGDLDGDGRVTLFELYTQTYRDTVRRSGAAVTAQRPSLEAELLGSGEWVVTQPARAPATLRLAPGLDGRSLVFAMPSGAVMGELEGGVGALALPPGRFLVQRRSGSELGVAQLELPFGGNRTLESKDFRPVSRSEWVAKGGQVELQPWRVDAKGGMGAGLGSIEQLAGRVELGLVLALGSLELGLSAGYARGLAKSVGLVGGFDAVELTPHAGVRWVRSSVAFTLRGGLLYRQAWLELARADEPSLGSANLSSRRAFRYPTVGPKAEVVAAVFLGGGFSLVLSLGTALGVREEVDDRGAKALAARPELGVGFGVGHAF